MSYFRHACALLASVLLTGVALAQDAPKEESGESPPPAAERERPGREEMRRRMLEQFDADKDGQLSEEEREKARQFRRERMERGEGGRGRGGEGRRGPGGPGPDGRRAEGPPPGGPMGPGGLGPRMAMRLFDEFDADKDEKLSKDEFERLIGRLRELRGPGAAGPGGPGFGPGPRRGPGPGPGMEDGPRRRPGDGPRDGGRRGRRPPREESDDRPASEEKPQTEEADDSTT